MHSMKFEDVLPVIPSLQESPRVSEYVNCNVWAIVDSASNQVQGAHATTGTTTFFLQTSLSCHWYFSMSWCLQYQNCLRRFYHSTDPQILLYLARTHYEAEQWQECKRVLLRAIHLAPSNYMLRFDAAIAMQKFSTATLQKAKRTADEVNFPFVRIEGLHKSREK